MDLQNLEIEILTLRHELHQLKIKSQEQGNKIIEQAAIINKITIENQEGLLATNPPNFLVP